MPTTGNGGYASKYTDGAAVDKRLDQGYYDDLIAAGIAAGLYTAETAPTKADLDKMIASGKMPYTLKLITDTNASSGFLNVTQEQYNSLLYANANDIPVFVVAGSNEGGHFYVTYPTITSYPDGGLGYFQIQMLGADGCTFLKVNKDLSVMITGTTVFVNETEVLKKGNTTAFNPNKDYDPATKKYVDDNSKALIIEAHEDKATEADYLRLRDFATGVKTVSVYARYSPDGPLYPVISARIIGEGVNEVISFVAANITRSIVSPVFPLSLSIRVNAIQSSNYVISENVDSFIDIDDIREYVDFHNYMNGIQVVDRLDQIDGSAANVIANVTASSSLSFWLLPPRMMTIKINNTTAADIIQELPTADPYDSMMGPSVTIPANSYVELSLWSIDGKISIRTGEHA